MRGYRSLVFIALAAGIGACGGGGSGAHSGQGGIFGTGGGMNGAGGGGAIGTGGDGAGGAIGAGGGSVGGAVGTGGDGLGGGTGAGGEGSDGGMGGVGGGTADGGQSCPSVPDPGAPVGSTVDFVAGVTVSTLAGSGVPGDSDGTGAGVGFENPVTVTVAPNGNLFVAEYDGNRIRSLTPAGVSATVIAAGILDQPFGLVAASNDVLYVDTDRDPQHQKSLTSGTVWRIDVPSSTATVVKADVGQPRGMAVLLDGRVALSDFLNNRLMLLDPQTSTVTPLAGNGCPGFADGQGTAAQFSTPYGIAVRSDGTLVVADWGNQRIRTVTLDGTVGTLAGDGVNGMVDGNASQARFYFPEAVAVDASGAVYVADHGNHRIRRLAAGMVRTLAGDGDAGFADGAGAGAEFYGEEGLAVTPDGLTVFVSDGTDGESDASPHQRVRAIAIPAGN